MSRVEQLIKLSSEIDYKILIEYINILNEAEINFQRSINQRLLIELSVLRIASLEFNEEKKKSKYRLIPISSFQSEVFLSQLSNAVEQNKSKPLANINLADFQTSTLSLKSLEKNKEIIDSEIEQEKEYDDKKEVNLEEIIGIWNEYTENQEQKGRYNISSILRISKPKLKNNLIIYSVPNNTTALEIESEKQQLILFIRNSLDSKIELSIKIDKKIDKKIAYTNKEKYELMKNKNPLIENLRSSFKLSI